MARSRLPLVIVVLALCAVAIGATAAGKYARSTAPTQATIPLVQSYVNGITISDVRFLPPVANRPALVEVTLSNQTDRAVTAFQLQSGTHGYAEGGPTTPILAAHSTRTVSFPARNLVANATLQLGAVRFADGQEEGRPEVLNIMHGGVLAPSNAQYAPAQEVAPVP
jgi:hypothetical protein